MGVRDLFLDTRIHTPQPSTSTRRGLDIGEKMENSRNQKKRVTYEKDRIASEQRMGRRCMRDRTH